MEKHLNVPANTEELAELKSGDYVYLTGTIYTARDAAHKRMYEILQKGGEEKAARLARKVGRTGGTAARGIFEYASGRRSWEDELKRRFHV